MFWVGTYSFFLYIPKLLPSYKTSTARCLPKLTIWDSQLGFPVGSLSEILWQAQSTTQKPQEHKATFSFRNTWGECAFRKVIAKRLGQISSNWEATASHLQPDGVQVGTAHLHTECYRLGKGWEHSSHCRGHISVQREERTCELWKTEHKV